MVLFHPLKFTKRVRFDHTQISTESDEPQSESSPYLGQNLFWLVFFANPLKNHGVRQLGWWNSQVNGKITCSKPPNSSFVYVQSLIRTISIGKIPDITRKFFYGQERTNFGTYRFLGSIFQSFLRCQEIDTLQETIIVAQYVYISPLSVANKSWKHLHRLPVRRLL